MSFFFTGRNWQANYLKIIVVFSTIYGHSCAFASFKVNSYKDAGAIYMQLADRISREYVEPVNQEKLLEGSLIGMLESLDPHSSYFSPEKFKAVQNQTSGVYGGLGIEIMMQEGVLRVISPIDDGPGFKAGLMAGDLIVMIKEEPVMGLTLTEASERLRGAPGSPIKITIQRNGQLKDMTLKRELITNHPVKYKMIGAFGYIRISTFNNLTHKELLEALKHLEIMGKSKIKGYIFDVRNNAGGLFDQAILVSNEFIKKGIIVSIKARDPTKNMAYEASGNDRLEGFPIVILMNGGSASAAEIFAGALQDNQRALIVGTKSFGKGSVQTIFPLSFGGAIKLTTAYYLTPSGKSIQKSGIAPDIEVKQLVNLQSISEEIRYRESSFKKALNPIASENTTALPIAPSTLLPQQIDDKKVIPQNSSKNTSGGPFEGVNDYQLEQAINVLKALQLKNKIPKTLMP